MTALLVMVGFAAGGFFVLFSPWTKDAIAFWPMMCLTTGFLAAGALLLDRGRLKSIYTFKTNDIAVGQIGRAHV